MGKMDGMVAAVTGGASGIGEATVRRFIAEGAQVAFADRDAVRGNRVAAEIAAEGRVDFFEADVGRESSCLAFIEHAVKRFGRLNILVNNAGIRMYQTVVEATAESWDEILGVNLKSYAYCAKGAIPAMRRAGGGSIINISSTAGLVGSPGTTSAYTATKGAVRLFTKATATQHAKDKIRCNSVHPGPIATDMIKDTLENPAQWEQRLQRLPMRRVGTPEDVAYGVLYLASDESSFVTGSELVIDGGTTAE